MRIVLQSDGRPYGSGNAGSAAGGVMAIRIILLIPGVFLTLHALSVYPLLDSRAAMGVLLCGFLAAAVLQVVSFVRNKDGTAMRWASACSSLGLVLLGLSLFANGSLDHAQATEMKAAVLEKSVVTGRHDVKQYYLFVASWRPGGGRESLLVSSSVFEDAAVGKDVSVELHEGYFGLSWYGRISVG